MPTERFLNLPEEKQQRILLAARDEISRVPFEEVSINKIIKQAGIPRGSFYQYFEDKHDLRAYLATGYQQGMLDTLGQSLAASGGNVFVAIRDIFAYTVDFGTNEENYAFCKNIFACKTLHTENAADIMEAVQKENTINNYWPQVSLAQFRATDENFITDFLELLVLVFHNSIQKIFTDITQKEQVQKSFLNQVTMIQHGIMKEAENINV